MLPLVPQSARMTTLQYTRTTGLKLTYRIQADDRGGYAILLGDKELLRGRDGLSAGGRQDAPNKRKAVGAAREAMHAIERLSLMDER